MPESDNKPVELAEANNLLPASNDGQGQGQGRDDLPRGKCSSCASTLLSNRYTSTLPPDASAADKFLDAFRCPLHSFPALTLTSILAPVCVGLSAHLVLGEISTPPNGTLFLILVLVVLGTLLGRVFALVRLPPLLGMLLAGIVVRNIPGLELEKRWDGWSSALRAIALIIILFRAGLGLDPAALKRLSGATSLSLSGQVCD